jgi:hypothetical protein
MKFSRRELTMTTTLLPWFVEQEMKQKNHFALLNFQEFASSEKIKIDCYAHVVVQLFTGDPVGI